MNKYLKSVEVINESDSFGQAWYRGLRYISMTGRDITFGSQKEPKYARDACLIFNLTGKALQEAIDGEMHPQFPTKENIRLGYLKEWDRGYDWKKQGFTYCYEDRAEAYDGYAYSERDEEFKLIPIDQWKLAREDISQQIANQISSNRNVIVIGNPSIDRYEIPDSPPCLREMWIRFEGIDNGIPLLSAHWKFRSRDFGSAWMTNINGILHAMHREVINPNGAKLIQVVDMNDSAHVYRGDFGLFDTVKPIVTLAR